MTEEPATDGSGTEVTLDPEWLEEEKDRLLGWEILRQAVFGNMEPLGPQEICDRIGEKKGYVWRVVQSAGRAARSVIEESTDEHEE